MTANLYAHVALRLLEPAMQRGIGYPKVLGDVQDRLLTQPPQLHRSSSELGWYLVVTSASPPGDDVATVEVPGEPGQDRPRFWRLRRWRT